ncbi:MAG: penicillin-binding protein 2 [Anaerolineae bacterium]
MNETEIPVPKGRFLIFGAVVALAFAILTFQLWRLQMVQGDYYRLKADRNRFRLVSVDAPRGVIYDRQGRILVRNQPSFTIAIVPADLPRDKEDAVFVRLSALLGLPASSQSALAGGNPRAGIKELVDAGRANPYSPVIIKRNVPRDVAFIIEEEHLELPGVLVQIEPIRQYVEGPLLSHILGYVGSIPQEQAEAYISRGYHPNDRVGVAGVELTFEDWLRGTKGRKHIEVDVAGRAVRTVGQPLEPRPGHNLILTLDLDLQRAAEEALRQGMEAVGSDSGVVIAMNPQTGEILAMVSLPTYDDNLFAGGISAQDYERLSSDPGRPLFNRAISGQYPTGSTFKIVPAAAGLEEKVITRQTHLFDPGVIWVPNKYAPDDPELAQPFYCWNKSGHGSINIIEGIAYSCDVFFYEVAGGFSGRHVPGGERVEPFQGLGIERLAEYARLFGFGERTGIALPGESAGLVGDDRWKRQNLGESWVTGDTYNMAIGQGFFLATPLQLLNATAAVANGGTLYRPQVVLEVHDVEGRVVQPFTPQVIRQVPISADNLALVREGMRGAVAWGTAWRANLDGVAVAGKTGTAEFFIDRDGDGREDRNKDGHLPAHAWFTAFAPYEDPQIALVVFVDGGSSKGPLEVLEGSQVAAPIAAKILRSYFGLPEPTPTPTPEASAQVNR